MFKERVNKGTKTEGREEWVLAGKKTLYGKKESKNNYRPWQRGVQGRRGKLLEDDRRVKTEAEAGGERAATAKMRVNANKEKWHF